MEKKLIFWDDTYSVGNDEIDNQHKELINQLNKLYNLYLEKEIGKMPEIITALKDYTNYHFKTEETFFRNFNYPLAAEHTQIHNDFITELQKLENDFKNNPNILCIKILTMLQNWLMNHILVEDKKYMKYLNKARFKE